MVDEESVRLDLTRRLRREPDEAIWAYLVDRRYVAEVRTGELTIEALVAEYRYMEDRFPAAGRGARRARVVAEGTTNYHDEDEGLRAAILSDTARQLPYVIEWRKAHLSRFRGGLLSEGVVTAWMLDQGEREWSRHGREGVAALYCSDPDFRSAILGLLERSPFGVLSPWFPALSIPRPDDPEERELRPFEGPHYLAWRQGEQRLFMEIPTDGALMQLKCVAYVILRDSYVGEDEAVRFILTDRPMIPVRGEYRVEESIVARAQRYVTLTVDPDMSRKEVADLYAQAIAHLPKSRNRALSEKLRSLIIYCYPHVGFRRGKRDRTFSWRDLMEAWNSQHPDWRYDLETAFARDYWRDLKILIPPDKHPSLWKE